MLSAERLSGYVEVTLEALTLAHLKDCADQLGAAEDEPIRLFLAARSAHLALVTALTAAVAGTASIGAFEKAVQAEWLKYFENSREGRAESPQSDRVMSCAALLRAAKADAVGYLEAPLNIEAEDEELLQRLTSLRDRTEHPRAETNMVCPTYIARAIYAGSRWAMHCLRAVWHHLDEPQQERAEALHCSIETQCAVRLSLQSQER